MPEEVVYVLGAPDSNTVKIGRTTNLPKRIAEIQRMSPVPLAVLWTTPGGHKLETRLHRHFDALRTHGEWFAFTSGDPVQLIQEAIATQPWSQKRQTDRQRPDYGSPEGLPELRAAILSDVAKLKGVNDPLERFRSTRAFRSKLSGAERGFTHIQRAAVLELKQAGHSWRQVGNLLGISGARAEQIAKAA
jgi:hypothetical protein